MEIFSDVVFLENPLPSANAVLIRGARPVLFDTGFGCDVDRLEEKLLAEGVSPGRLALVVNTHHHSDHVGGNHWLQSGHGVPIAAEKRDAAWVNARDPRACDGDYLAQPVEPYRVDRPLVAGETLKCGRLEFEILQVPGHTPTSLAFWHQATGFLIGGDVVHDQDLGWLDLPRRGPQVLGQALQTVERLAALPIRVMASGHGPLVEQPAESLARARQRLLSWQREPSKALWHGLKRIFAYALLMHGGMSEHEVGPYLKGTAWHEAYAMALGLTGPGAFQSALLEEMLRSGAAVWQGPKLVATAPHREPSASWLATAPQVSQWG